MKISYNWLKQFIDTNKTPQELSALLTGCGLEVEHLENWVSLKGGLKDIVVGHVLTCDRHPNADRLSVTTVDAGDGNVRQIVCGAPNVAAGQKVIVALPGAVMYPSEGEPFEIKKSKIRGEASEGMICAEDEIGLGTSHAGIMILPEDTKPGMPAADYFGIENDWVFEIGLTPNRADAASHLGVARDLVALLSDEKAKLNFGASQNVAAGSSSGKISVEVKNHEGCKRYSGVTISGVKVQDSPDWLKNKLKAIGVRPINNIVDATNYILHDLGQPLHAFDADKISGGKIIVGTLTEGTIFKTLDEVDRKLSGSELMIADASGGLCIAGVFGGIHSGVTATTSNIFIESAYFDSVMVRKAARFHGLHTDSSFRFERGTDPEMTLAALQKAVSLIIDIAGGKAEETFVDIYPIKVNANKIELSYTYLNTLAGNEIPKDVVKRILNDLQITTVKEVDDALTVEVPAFKVDVTRPADLVEEVIRIYGYNAIELPKKMSVSIAPARKPDVDAVVNRMGAWLVDNGFNEILNNSLTRISNMDVIPLAENKEGVTVLNPLSNDLGMLRHDMLIPGLDAVAYNINRKQKELKFFETGKTYVKSGPVYSESRHLAIWITGDLHGEHWRDKSPKSDIYFLKSVVNAVLEVVGVNIKGRLNQQEGDHACLNSCLSLMAKKNRVAVMGEVNKKTLKLMDINQPVFYAEFNLDYLFRLVPVNDKSAPEPPKFPEVRRDLSMMLDKQVSYQEVEKLAYATEPKLLKNVNLFDVYEGEKIEAGKKSYALSFMLRDEQATLQDKQIDQVMDKLMKQFEQKLNATIRRQ
jgi:phenylalanyl-tRNA synthetase beta chain